MRTRSAMPLAALVVCFAFATLSHAQQPPATRPADADVPVKEVVLFSSGVGYFEHAGTVKGNGSTVLHFKTDQINDILKSLLLEDLDGGRVGTVRYPSQAPLNRTLKSFQVDITSNPPLAELLNQLRGARVAVVILPDQRIEGTILGVENRSRAVGADKQVVPAPVLNLRSGGTIRPVLLDEVQSVEMEDARLNHELDAALASLAQARDQDEKPVEISFKGQGERRVRIGYLVETPVWKTSYRLVLDAPAADRNATTSARLQGWAIIENQTDSDWNDVRLSLVSGRPISFIEDLYHSLYVPRPFVEPELYASLIPQTYQNGITKADIDKLQQARNDHNAQFGGQRGGGGAAGTTGGATISNSLFANAGQLANQPQQPIDPIASVVSQASVSGLGELFQYAVGDVTIPRQQSAMIPIIAEPIEARKVSIYNKTVLLDHPLNGLRLKNTTRKHLLQGPLTILEAGSYAGDAQIDIVPPGQRRLLSYGIDLKMLVQMTNETGEHAVQSAKLADGVLQLVWKDVSEVTYLIDNKSAADRTLVIEEPRQPGWKPVEPAAADETTDSVFRFERKAPGGKVLKFPIRQEIVHDEQVQLVSLAADKFEIYLKAKSIPAKVREALDRIAALKRAVGLTQQQIEQQNQRIAAISSEQGRIRENMKAVSPNTDYYTRLIKKLDEQESQIEGLQKETAALQKQLDTQRNELDSKINQSVIG